MCSVVIFAVVVRWADQNLVVQLLDPKVNHRPIVKVLDRNHHRHLLLQHMDLHLTTVK
jgi:hypothetical protein